MVRGGGGKKEQQRKNPDRESRLPVQVQLSGLLPACVSCSFCCPLLYLSMCSFSLLLFFFSSSLLLPDSSSVFPRVPLGQGLPGDGFPACWSHTSKCLISVPFSSVSRSPPFLFPSVHLFHSSHSCLNHLFPSVRPPRCRGSFKPSLCSSLAPLSSILSLSSFTLSFSIKHGELLTLYFKLLFSLLCQPLFFFKENTELVKCFLKRNTVLGRNRRAGCCSSSCNLYVTLTSTQNPKYFTLCLSSTYFDILVLL